MTPDGPQKDELVRAALRKLLRPLARVMIRSGVTLPAAVDILKTVLVSAAVHELDRDGQARTDSAISVLTGVHRKDVRQIRHASDADQEDGRTRNSLLATVIARWMAEDAYLDDAGEPRPLPRSADGSGTPSLAGLIGSVARDVHPRTVFDALLAQGLIRLDAETDTVHLAAEALVPKASEAELISFFANNLHDHIAAATHNLLEDEEGERLLERAVFYSDLSEASAEEIKQMSTQQAMALLREINALALERQQDDDGKADANRRIRLGVYFYEESEDQ